MQSRERPPDNTIVMLEKYRKAKTPKLTEPVSIPHPDVKEDVAYYLMMAIKALKNGRH